MLSIKVRVDHVEMWMPSSMYRYFIHDLPTGFGNCNPVSWPGPVTGAEQLGKSHHAHAPFIGQLSGPPEASKGLQASRIRCKTETGPLRAFPRTSCMSLISASNR